MSRQRTADDFIEDAKNAGKVMGQKTANQLAVEHNKLMAEEEKKHKKAVSGYEYLVPKLNEITLQKGYTVSKD